MKTEVSEFTYSEFINYVEETPRVKSKDSSETNTHGFTQTDSMEEAINYARYGWDTGIKEMEAELDLIINGTVEVAHEICGAIPDVGRYLSGVPDNMFQFIDRVERDKDFLEIFVPLTYNAGHDSKDALLYAKRILQFVAEKSARYSIKLTGIFGSTQIGTIGIEFITIKDFTQQLVLNNLAFAFHPSFFRRLWFKFIETKHYMDTSGYGRPLSKSQIIEQIQLLNPTTEWWVMPYFNDVENNWTEADVQKFAR